LHSIAIFVYAIIPTFFPVKDLLSEVVETLVNCNVDRQEEVEGDPDLGVCRSLFFICTCELVNVSDIAVTHHMHSPNPLVRCINPSFRIIEMSQEHQLQEVIKQQNVCAFSQRMFQVRLVIYKNQILVYAN